jgi:cytochrome c551/c552
LIGKANQPVSWKFYQWLQQSIGYARKAELFRILRGGSTFPLFEVFNHRTERNMKSIIVSIVATAGLMLAGGVMAEDMPALAKKNNCTACHSVDKKVVGPAWMDVSKKYKGAANFEYNGKQYPLMEGLMMKVSKGGSGHWGSMPMPANDASGTKQSEIKELVTFILGLAK